MARPPGLTGRSCESLGVSVLTVPFNLGASMTLTLSEKRETIRNQVIGRKELQNRKSKLKSTPLMFDENLFSLMMYSFMLYKNMANL